METSAEPGIEVSAIAAVMRNVLPKLKVNRESDEVDESVSALIAENEKLGEAFYKSKYATRHIDWEYALQLIYAVLEAGGFTDAQGFAEKLNAAVKSTAAQRDFVVVVPLAFAGRFGVFDLGLEITRQFEVGQFRVVPPVASATALNRILKRFDASAVEESLFAHQVTQSHRALSNHPLVIFEAHGSSHSVRRQVNPDLRRFIGLVELFGRVFEADRSIFSGSMVSNHIFLTNKRNGYLDRIPQVQPLTVSLPLSRSLIMAIRRPEVASFLSLLASSNGKGLVGRLRNALQFFGRAVNEKNHMTRFLFNMIAMEAIFSRDKNAPIKATLADYAANLCFRREDRRTAHSDLSKMYDVRSAIVHNGVSEVDRHVSARSEAFAARAIYCSLSLAHMLKSGEGSHEDRFFSRLRDMKIGVESNRLRLPTWRGSIPPSD